MQQVQMQRPFGVYQRDSRSITRTWLVAHLTRTVFVFPPASRRRHARKVTMRDELLTMTRSNEITAASAGNRFGFAGKSRVGLSLRPGVAEFDR